MIQNETTCLTARADSLLSLERDTSLVDHSEPLLLPLIFAELVNVHVVGIFDAGCGHLVDFVVDVAQYRLDLLVQQVAFELEEALV